MYAGYRSSQLQSHTFNKLFIFLKLGAFNVEMDYLPLSHIMSEVAKNLMKNNSLMVMLSLLWYIANNGIKENIII